MDIVSPRIRSAIMSKIRSKGNKSTERKLRAFLAGRGISGWRVNAKDVIGRPDIFFYKKNLAVFIDGCFWHGCPRCYRRPRSKRKFWDKKVTDNLNRDKRVNKLLRAKGVRILRISECFLKKNPREAVGKIEKCL